MSALDEIEAIRQLKYRYLRAVDLKLWDLLASTFAVDAVCHQSLLEKRLAMGVKVNRHPMFSEYLRYAQRLGLGIGEVSQIKHVLLG